MRGAGRGRAVGVVAAASSSRHWRAGVCAERHGDHRYA